MFDYLDLNAIDIDENDDIIDDENLICCELPMQSDKTFLICSTCGRMKEDYKNEQSSYTTKNLYMDTENDDVNFRIKGPNNKIYEKKTTINNNKNNQKKNTIKQVTSLKQNDTSNLIPDYILLKAANLYYESIQKYTTKRGNIKKGIMVIFIYYECLKEGILRKISEICQITKVDMKYVNKGMKQLNIYMSIGLLNLPIHIDIIPFYIDRYFKLLNIHDYYKKFVSELVYFSLDNNICRASRKFSRVIGAIYVLIKLTEAPFSKDFLTQKCDISRGTIVKFCQTIMDILEKNSEYYTVDQKNKLTTIIKTNLPWIKL